MYAYDEVLAGSSEINPADLELDRAHYPVSGDSDIDSNIYSMFYEDLATLAGPENSEYSSLSLSQGDSIGHIVASYEVRRTDPKF